MSSFCTAKATHIFSAKNLKKLYIESAKIVNKMALNELVKLTTLWTTGPSLLFSICWHQTLNLNWLLWQSFTIQLDTGRYFNIFCYFQIKSHSLYDKFDNIIKCHPWKLEWLCWGLMTCQPLWVILCCLPENGRKEIEEIVEETRKRDGIEKKQQELKWRNRRNKNIPPLPLPATRIAGLAHL